MPRMHIPDLFISSSDLAQSINFKCITDCHQKAKNNFFGGSEDKHKPDKTDERTAGREPSSAEKRYSSSLSGVIDPAWQLTAIKTMLGWTSIAPASLSSKCWNSQRSMSGRTSAPRCVSPQKMTSATWGFTLLLNTGFFSTRRIASFLSLFYALCFLVCLVTVVVVAAAVVVESYYFLNNNYCWLPSTTSPRSRLRAVTLSNKSIYKIQLKPVGSRGGCLLLRFLLLLVQGFS